jgi:hypothetical protein
LPNGWLNNKEVVWLSLLVYLLTGLGPVCASFSGAYSVACDERSSSCQNAFKAVGDDELGDYSPKTTRCTPDGNGNDSHLFTKSRLRISRTLGPTCAILWGREQTITQAKENVWSRPPFQSPALQQPQSLKQLRTIVLLN